MKDFEFLDFPQCRHGRCSNERYIGVSRNSEKRKISYRVGISNLLSSEILDKGLTHFRLRVDNYTGDTHLIVFRGDDADNGRISREGDRLKIGSKALVDYLAKRLGKDGDFLCVRIKCSENIANDENYLTYKLDL